MVVAPSLDPAWTTATSGAALASAAFSPVAGSLVIACAVADSGSSGITCVFSNSGGLTFTDIGTIQIGTSGGACHAAWAYTAGAVSNMTITATWSGTGTSGAKGTKPVTFTGTHTTSPIGITSAGTSATNNVTPTYTNGTDQSLGFGLASEFNALGLPTSTDTEVAFHLTNVDGLSAYKAAVTSGTGNSVGINLDAGGTSAAAWAYKLFEIKPAPAAAANSLVVPNYRALRHLMAR